MVRTLLINPPYSLEERYGSSMGNFGAVTEPMALAYLAGSLLESRKDVDLIDAPAFNYTVEEVVEMVKNDECKLVGITFLTPMFDAVKRLADRLKDEDSELKIIVGGPHPTALPKRTLKEIPSVDYVCFGEGEKTIVEVVDHLEGKKKIGDVAGIVYRLGDEIKMNSPRPFEQDLDIIPMPARNLLPMSHYNLTASRTKGSTHCPTLIVARGCPFDCQYCSHPFGRTFRHHSIERVIAELKELKRVYGVTQVNLEADTLTVSKEFINGLCDAMVNEKLNLTWTCESRVDTVDKSTLVNMKRAGCWQISYGVESGSQRMLDLIHKGITKEKVKETFKLTKDVGISIRGFFMLGLPDETPSESMETINFAKELDAMWSQFTITIPYPGTPMYSKLDAEGKIRHHNWSHYNTWGGWAGKELPFLAEGRTQNELKALQKKALRMFYMRPKVFIRFISTITTYGDLKKYAMGFTILLKTAFEKKN